MIEFKHTHTLTIQYSKATVAHIPVSYWPVDDNVVLFYTANDIENRNMASFYTCDGELFSARPDGEFPVECDWTIVRKGFERQDDSVFNKINIFSKEIVHA